jgi:hypothetical protein
MTPSCPLPDPAICKTKHAFGSYCWCIANEVLFCNHRFSFGNGNLCHLPNSNKYETYQSRVL